MAEPSAALRVHAAAGLRALIPVSEPSQGMHGAKAVLLAVSVPSARDRFGASSTAISSSMSSSAGRSSMSSSAERLLRAGMARAAAGGSLLVASANGPAMALAAHSVVPGRGAQMIGVRCQVNSLLGRTVHPGGTSSASRNLPVRIRVAPSGWISSYTPA
eukprot:scaffold69688_cov32-Tisochrysis_lutea.AAC.5